MRFRSMEALAAIHPWRRGVVPVGVAWGGFVLLSLLGRDAPTQGFLAFVVVCMGRISRADFRLWGKAVGVATGFASVASLSLVVDWDPAAMRLMWNPGGIARASLVLGRTVVCSAVTLWCVQTIPISRVLDLLWKLGVSPTLLELVRLVHRAILVLDHTLCGIQRGMEARNGFALWRRRGHAFRMATAALFSRSQSMARRQESALASRGGESGLVVLHRDVEWMPLATAGVLAGVCALGAAMVVWGRFHVQ